MTEGLWRTAAVRGEEIAGLMARHHLPRRVATWARLYGIDEDSFVGFTEPETMDWSSPYRFHGMQRAVGRIQQAIRLGERIVVVGDYDVDGVTASVILCETLRRMGADWHCILPHRVLDGYGLSTDIVDRAHRLEANVIVTVDNGIAAADAVIHANRCGIDVIITDHHAPGDRVPNDAFALVHWAKSEQPEVCSRLSGAGVSLKLACALRAPLSDAASEPDPWFLGLAAMAALADVMPMVGENRKLVRLGLRALASEQRPGWLALCERAQMTGDRLTEQSILWNVTPRLNAAGRMDSAEVAFQLLMTEDDATAAVLASRIEDLNRQRRVETELATAEAMARCAATGERGSGVVVFGTWNLGVVGIVAAKLCETLGRPAIVFADDGGDVLKGSGRAPDGFPLHHAISSCATWLHHYGGHDSAVGCAVSRLHLEAFQAAFSEACAAIDPMTLKKTDATVQGDGTRPMPLADDWLSLAEVNYALLEWLERFRPFGPEVPEPTFFLGPITVQSAASFSDGKHLRFKVTEEKWAAELVWFQVPAEAARVKPGSQIAAVVVVEENYWRGRKSIQLRVKRLIPLVRPVTRNEFAQVFVALRHSEATTLDGLCSMLPQLSRDHLQMMVTTFVELGFAGQVDSAYHVVKQAVSRDLRESISYQIHLWSQVCLPEKGE